MTIPDTPSVLVPVLAVWHFALGLTVGSFLNVCIHRLPRGLPVTGRSHCPSCGTTLGLLDVVPLASQLVLGARCRYCGARFSWRYFAIELVTGLAYVGAFLLTMNLRDGDAVYLARLLIGFPCLLGIIVVDFETYTIPDGLLVALAVAGLGSDLAYRFMGSDQLPPIDLSVPGFGSVPVLHSVLGAAVGFGGLWALGRLFSSLLGEEAMGFGDVKFLGAAGALVGPGVLLLAFFILAVALGAVAGMGAILARKLWARDDSEHRVSRTRLPFGPFLALSLGIALAAPEEMAGVFVYLYGLSGGLAA